jgi:hypothetical protein
MIDVKVSGPHPFFPFEESTFCGYVRPLLLA